MKIPITGATNGIDRGIGRETARQLFPAGMVVLLRRRSESKARHQATTSLSGDVSDDEWEHVLGNDKPVKTCPGN
jgi:NAD(P)-dependent dehydrogenase (short-subunit alcohol dehydrogenase family)